MPSSRCQSIFNIQRAKKSEKYILLCFDGKSCNFTGFERHIGLQVADIESWIANTFYHLLLV